MFKERYFKKRKELLNDNINPNNVKIIKDFLKFQEYKLKRNQGLSEVDERSYKTLYYYLTRLKNLNNWFDNKDWSKLTKKDITLVIDNLEDGIIKTKKNTRFADRSLYYQMMRGKLFKLVKKDSIARDILDEFSIKGRKDENQVRFITEDDFRNIVECVPKPIQKCLLWLAWDIGENINSLLELEKKDFKRQTNPDTNESEYLVILSKEKLKRSRTPRSELTNYPETTKYLDLILNNLKPTAKTISNKYIKNKKLSDSHSDDKLFKFKLGAARKFLKSAINKLDISCVEGQSITWKDFRSSMACHLLKNGWTTDEVNARLGHKPSSRMIDKYINYLALDRKIPKKKVYEGNLKRVELELEKSKEINKLQGLRIENLRKSEESFKEELVGLSTMFKAHLKFDKMGRWYDNAEQIVYNKKGYWKKGKKLYDSDRNEIKDKVLINKIRN